MMKRGQRLVAFAAGVKTVHQFPDSIMTTNCELKCMNVMILAAFHKADCV